MFAISFFDVEPPTGLSNCAGIVVGDELVDGIFADHMVAWGLILSDTII